MIPFYQDPASLPCECFRENHYMYAKMDVDQKKSGEVTVDVQIDPGLSIQWEPKSDRMEWHVPSEFLETWNDELSESTWRQLFRHM